MKIANCICLCIWIFEVFYGIFKWANGTQIDPIIFTLAAVCLVLQYIKEILTEE
jgi:hypothetical protein